MELTAHGKAVRGTLCTARVPIFSSRIKNILGTLPPQESFDQWDKT
jgi:hypothetical protein